MFRFSHRSRDLITIFHKASSPTSTRVLNLLKQTSAAASETATEDQASDHTAQNKIQRSEFDLDVVEGLPTKDQLKNILEYSGANAGQFVEGATSESDAMKKLSEGTFKRPVVVDWNNGKAVSGESESEIMKLLKSSQ